MDVTEIQQEAELEKQKKTKEAEKFKKYIENTGINLAFQIIFAEVVSKNIPESEVFTYAAERLKHIGAEMQKFNQAEVHKHNSSEHKQEKHETN